MKKIQLGILLACAFWLTGCSGAFWGGTATGAGGAAAGYELRSRQQMQQVEEDFKSGKIDQREYDIRRDQIKRGSLAY